MSLRLLEQVLGQYRVARTRFALRACERVGEGTRVLGPLHVHGGGRLLVGRRVFFDARFAPIELHCHPDAEIEIGDDVLIEGGVSLEAAHRIVVGPGARLRSFVKVLDNHFHRARGDRHLRPTGVELRIEEGADVGSRAILLPGAHLLPGVVVGPGTVLSRKVPAGVRVAGLPARVVREGA